MHRTDNSKLFISQKEFCIPLENMAKQTVTYIIDIYSAYLCEHIIAQDVEMLLQKKGKFTIGKKSCHIYHNSWNTLVPH